MSSENGKIKRLFRQPVIKVPDTVDLDKIFCFKHERVVNNDNTISFNHRILQIGPSELRVSFAKCRVTVYEHIDGSITVGYGPHMLGYYPPRDLSTNATNINQKRTHHLLERIGENFWENFLTLSLGCGRMSHFPCKNTDDKEGAR